MSRLCQLCKRQKKKCDGQSPCSRCAALGLACNGPDLFVNCGTANSVVKGRGSSGQRTRVVHRKPVAHGSTEAPTSRHARLRVKEDSRSPDTANSNLSHSDDLQWHHTFPTTYDVSPAESCEVSRRGSYSSSETSIETISTFSPGVNIETVAIAKHFAPIYLYDKGEAALVQPMASVFARHFSRASLGSPLKSATEAVALLLFSQSTAQDTGRVLASEVHVTALRAVQSQLNDLPQDEQKLNELMLAIMALGQYEGFSASANGRQVYNKHIDGLAQLITVVTKRFPDCYLALGDVLDTLIPTILFNHCFRAVPQDKYRFPESQRQGTEAHDLIADISRGLGPLTQLRSRAARLHTLTVADRKMEAEQIAHGLVCVEKGRQEWLSAIPKQSRAPIRIRRRALEECSTSTSTRLWPREAHVYGTPLAALLVDLAHIGHLLILDALRKCYYYGSSTNPDPDYLPDDDMTQQFSQDVTEEMCATTFTLVDRLTLDPMDCTTDIPRPVVDLNSSWRVITAMMTALDFGCLEPYQRQWVESAIINIRNAQSSRSP